MSVLKIMTGGFGIATVKDTVKCLFVHRTIRDFKLDFSAISETGRSNLLAPFQFFMWRVRL